MNVEMKWIKYLRQMPTIHELKGMLKNSNYCISNALPKQVFVLGAGGEGARLIAECEVAGIEVIKLFDNDVTKRGRSINGVLIEPYDALLDSNNEIPVIIASHRTYSATIGLRSLGFNVANYAALQILYPEFFKPHMFYDGLHDDLVTNGHEIIKLFDALSNIESQKVLDAIIGYRITLDPENLRGLIDWDLYGLSNVIRLNEEEVYVDGGSFDGDSIKIFMERVSGLYKRIYAFEPDPKTYKKLCENLLEYENIVTVNKGLHSCENQLRFNNDGSRGAIIADAGNIVINTCAIDHVVTDQVATFIKMNIEGTELEALDGARETITKSKPKLAISLYHRPSDLWAIPKKISNLGLGYEMHLSQHDGGIIESVLYAI